MSTLKAIYLNENIKCASTWLILDAKSRVLDAISRVRQHQVRYLLTIHLGPLKPAKKPRGRPATTWISMINKNLLEFGLKLGAEKLVETTGVEDTFYNKVDT